ncbi:hypothetical protein PVAP13_2KG405305 [Panicum virgatum]|uniref:Uncharacterized protein n=1 Tax=Panicum virgatum TaxID=38727 RepID=A0A8T0WFQ4_PANVG|nr:hypothetical protein PVAP13_2KG405305 [Panicum virgatum]
MRIEIGIETRVYKAASPKKVNLPPRRSCGDSGGGTRPPPGASPTPVRAPATCCWPASSLSSSMSSASLRRAVGRLVPRRPDGGAGIYGVCGAGEVSRGGSPVASCTASHGGGLAGGGCSVAPLGVPSGATPRVVGLVSSDQET